MIMKHFGDITKIDGSKVPIVDIVTGGSPCQDLSVAGKRAGLEGERSGLFLEMIRVIKEMRNADRERTGRTDEFLRPRFMVFENVEGLFSSNGGAMSNQTFYESNGYQRKVESETCGTITTEQNNHVRGDTPSVVETTFDARGHGGGEICGTITGGT